MRMDELVFQRTRVPQYKWIYLEKMAVGEHPLHSHHRAPLPSIHDLRRFPYEGSGHRRCSARGDRSERVVPCHDVDQESFSIFALRKYYLRLLVFLSGSCLSTASVYAVCHRVPLTVTDEEEVDAAIAPKKKKSTLNSQLFPLALHTYNGLSSRAIDGIHRVRLPLEAFHQQVARMRQ